MRVLVRVCARFLSLGFNKFYEVIEVQLVLFDQKPIIYCNGKPIVILIFSISLAA